MQVNMRFITYAYVVVIEIGVYEEMQRNINLKRTLDPCAVCLWWNVIFMIYSPFNAKYPLCLLSLQTNILRAEKAFNNYPLCKSEFHYKIWLFNSRSKWIHESDNPEVSNTSILMKGKSASFCKSLIFIW